MKNIKKKFTKKLITVFLSAFFVFGTISVVACGSTKIENVEQDTKLKSNDKIKTGVLENGMNYYVLENKIPANRITICRFEAYRFLILNQYTRFFWKFP